MAEPTELPPIVRQVAAWHREALRVSRDQVEIMRYYTDIPGMKEKIAEQLEIIEILEGLNGNRRVYGDAPRRRSAGNIRLSRR